MSIFTSKSPWTEAVKPPLGTPVNLDHPLCPTYGLAFQEGGGLTLQSFIPGWPQPTINGTPIWRQTEDGPAIEFDAVTEDITLGDTADLFSNVDTATIVFKWGKTDGARTSSSFGQMTAGFQYRVQSHMPWSNGQTYWDWGDNTEGAGRVRWDSSSGNQAEGTNCWAFVVDGVTSVQEIWQNGDLKASNATPISRTQSPAGNDFRINDEWGSDDGDLAWCPYFYIYDGRRLSPDEIISLYHHPYQIFTTQRYWSFAAAEAGPSNTHHVHLPLLGVG